MIEIAKYTKEHHDEWNKFVGESKNGTFLIDRHYMDYHSDRFNDCSLMFYEDGVLMALLPANLSGDTLYSHQGLTYGGLILHRLATTEWVMNLFRELNNWLRVQRIERVVYKPIPYIYNLVPADEDLYALFSVCQARLSARNIATVIDTKSPLKWKRDRRYGANKAHTDGIVTSLDDDYNGFWKILTDNLHDKYDARPVHSLEEISLLKSRFPEQIRLYTARLNGETLGGTLLYITPQVVHAQYISASQRGKHLHAIDAIYRQVICEDYAQWPYIDLGTSNEEGGHVLNASLIYQKEGFGGRGVCYDTYEWEVG